MLFKYTLFEYEHRVFIFTQRNTVAYIPICWYSFLKPSKARTHETHFTRNNRCGGDESPDVLEVI